jgi:hypothetical protein
VIGQIPERHVAALELSLALFAALLVQAAVDAQSQFQQQVQIVHPC